LGDGKTSTVNHCSELRSMEYHNRALLARLSRGKVLTNQDLL
jgi:hypothetical protein